VRRACTSKLLVGLALALASWPVGQPASQSISQSSRSNRRHFCAPRTALRLCADDDNNIRMIDFSFSPPFFFFSFFWGARAQYDTHNLRRNEAFLILQERLCWYDCSEFRNCGRQPARLYYSRFGVGVGCRWQEIRMGNAEQYKSFAARRGGHWGEGDALTAPPWRSERLIGWP